MQFFSSCGLCHHFVDCFLSRSILVCYSRISFPLLLLLLLLLLILVSYLQNNCCHCLPLCFFFYHFLYFQALHFSTLMHSEDFVWLGLGFLVLVFLSGGILLKCF